MKNQIEHKWMQTYLQGCVGFKIVGATLSKDDFPQLICQRGRGKSREEIILEISQDEEGNGPGFVFGLMDDPPDEERDGPVTPSRKVDRDTDLLPDYILADLLNKRITDDEAWAKFDEMVAEGYEAKPYWDKGETEDEERSNGPVIGGAK